MHTTPVYAIKRQRLTGGTDPRAVTTDWWAGCAASIREPKMMPGDDCWTPCPGLALPIQNGWDDVTFELVRNVIQYFPVADGLATFDGLTPPSAWEAYDEIVGRAAHLDHAYSLSLVLQDATRRVPVVVAARVILPACSLPHPRAGATTHTEFPAEVGDA